MKCATWRCEAEADWREPAVLYGFCRDHARREHFWPVSDWAYEQCEEGAEA